MSKAKNKIIEDLIESLKKEREVAAGELAEFEGRMMFNQQLIDTVARIDGRIDVLLDKLADD